VTAFYWSILGEFFFADDAFGPSPLFVVEVSGTHGSTALAGGGPYLLLAVKQVGSGYHLLEVAPAAHPAPPVEARRRLLSGPQQPLRVPHRQRNPARGLRLSPDSDVGRESASRAQEPWSANRSRPEPPARMLPDADRPSARPTMVCLRVCSSKAWLRRTRPYPIKPFRKAAYLVANGIESGEARAAQTRR
jgi:hypothetical protein